MAVPGGGNLRRSAQVVVGPQLDYVELVAAAVEPVGEPVRSQVGRIGAQDHALARSHVHDDLGALGGREQEPVHVTGAGSRPPPLPIMANARSSEKPKANTRFTDALSSRNRTFSVVRRGRAVGAVDQHVLPKATGLDVAVVVEAFVLHDQRDVVDPVVVRRCVGDRAVRVVEDEHAGQALLTCSSVWPCGCGWYHSVAAGWSMRHCGDQVSPGSIGWCGPPSYRAGMCMPCQCTVVVSSRSLCTFTRTSSPRAARRVGPR